jgi:hypothetical protein
MSLTRLHEVHSASWPGGAAWPVAADPGRYRQRVRRRAAAALAAVARAEGITELPIVGRFCGPRLAPAAPAASGSKPVVSVAS